MENKREGDRHAGSTRRSPPDHHCWVMENKRGESHAGSARCSPRSVTRKKGEREGLGRRSWRLTGERGGHMRRDVDRERRERVRESRFQRKNEERRIDWSSLEPSWLVRARQEAFGKGTRKHGPHMSAPTLCPVTLRPCFVIQ
jgi:hypothetical protein